MDSSKNVKYENYEEPILLAARTTKETYALAHKGAKVLTLIGISAAE
jgi:hypothetical protein